MEWIADFPNKWPQPWRHAFVLLCPLTVPLWLAGWVAFLATCLCLAGLMFGIGIISLFPALMLAAWKGREVNDPVTCVGDFWEDIYDAIVSVFKK